MLCEIFPNSPEDLLLHAKWDFGDETGEDAKEVCHIFYDLDHSE